MSQGDKELWEVDGTTWIIPLRSALVSDTRPSGFTMYLSDGGAPLISESKKQTIDKLTSHIVTQVGS